MSAGRLRFFPPTSAKKERDEELSLFRELFKREREKNMNLLESVSTELEPVDETSNRSRDEMSEMYRRGDCSALLRRLRGNSVVFKISAAKKGDANVNENEKNDYDWLKTPPATPLFQSLEMDVGQSNSPHMIIHKELPIIPPLKPSRFLEIMESKTRSKPPIAPSVSSFGSASSSRPESPDSDRYPLSPPRSITTPIATPRFGSQRFAKDSEKGPSAKPLQPGRFLRRKEELKPRPKSPGSISVASTAASSRPETPDFTPRLSSIRKAANIVRGKEEPKPVERSINRFGKEGPTNKKPDPKPPTRNVKSVVTKTRPTSPSSASVTTAASRPESPDSKLIKSKGVPKSLEKPIRKTTKEAPAKQNLESKPNSRTVSPLVRSRLPATLPDFPAEAPPNLITSVVPGRTTSATRSRPEVPARASAEQRRSPSVTKTRQRELEDKGNEKRGGNNSGVVIGSSMVERMLNARKSATVKAIVRGDKASKIRGM